MENKLSFWKKFNRSFNPSFSKEAMKWTVGEGYKYLALLLLVSAFFLSAWYTISFYSLTRTLPQSVEKFFKEDLKDFPNIKAKNGEISATKDPFLKEWYFEEEKVAVAVDTLALKKDVISGKYSSYEGGVFILKKEIITKTIDELEGEKIETFPLPKDAKFNLIFNPEKDVLMKIEGEKEIFSLTSQKIKKALQILTLTCSPFLLVVIYIASLIGNIFRLYFFSLFSLVINKSRKANLKYNQLLNIGIFSLTLIIVLETTLQFVPIAIPYSGFLKTVLYAGFLAAGILACKKDRELKSEKGEAEISKTAPPISSGSK